MIEDIVFEGVKYFELITDASDIYYPAVIIFGKDNSTDIIKTENITIF